MHRRDFLGAAIGGAALIRASMVAKAVGYEQTSTTSLSSSAAELRPSSPSPRSVGLLIQSAHGLDATISQFRQLGMSNCFLSLDSLIRASASIQPI